MVKTEKILWKKKYITVLMLSLLMLEAVLYGIPNGGRGTVYIDDSRTNLKGNYIREREHKWLIGY